MIITHGVTMKPGAPCVMHPHGLLPCVRWYRGRWLWPLQEVPAYHCNPKPSFSKSYFKSNRLKRVLFKTKDVLDFKNLHSNTLSYFNKEFPNPKTLPKQTLIWSKNNFQKGQNLKKFCFVNFFIVKAVGLFQMFWKPCSYYKMLFEKMFQTLCLCPWKKGVEKSSFLSNSVFQKKGRFMKTYFQSFFERLCKLIKVFGFPKFKKTTSKGTLFSNQNYFKLLPYLTKRKDFILG